MEVIYARCAGLDVHKDTVVAAVRIVTGGSVKTEVRTFDTDTPGLLTLSGWLAEQGCTHVAMEATGIYWKPVWHILSDGEVTLLLANAAHVKNVPGRKTDVADAVWLSDLLAHGLIRASFVPEPATQSMRALLRTRKQLVREQASHVQRLQKTLEDANVKLASVLASVVGLSGRAIVKALIEGETDPDKLVGLVHRGVKAPREKLFPGSVPTTAPPARAEKGDLRGRGVNAHGNLPHANRRRGLQGPRRRPLPEPLVRSLCAEPRKTNHQAWLYLHHCPTAGGGSFYLDRRNTARVFRAAIADQGDR